MPRIALKGGAYSARSIIADAQRAVNLYAEPNPEDAEAPATHYPTAGLAIKAALPDATTVRGTYTATNGELFAVCGQSVYYVPSTWTPVLIGTMTQPLGPTLTPVSMADNGTDVILVNGQNDGYQWDLATHTFAKITAAANSGTNGFGFTGADKVDYLDTFLIGNTPGTRQFFASFSNTTQFDSLQFASKTAYADPLASLAVVNRNIWLVGSVTAEVWYNAGGATFPFALMPGPFVQHGTCAVYSVASINEALLWLSLDRFGQAVVVMTNGYEATKVSTFAVEQAIQGYPTVSDAVAWCYQQQGHSFYVLNFPSADRSWCYDVTTGQWCEPLWIDSSGAEHRHRGNCSAFAYGVNICGDWQNGNLYQLTPGLQTDAGAPRKFLRSFPHLLDDMTRVHYDRIIADMECGNGGGDGSLTATPPFQPPIVNLRISFDRGRSWGNYVPRSLGASGQYLTSPLWTRNGMGRDAVFEFSWSAPVVTALQGAYIETRKSIT